MTDDTPTPTQQHNPDPCAVCRCTDCQQARFDAGQQARFLAGLRDSPLWIFLTTRQGNPWRGDTPA